MKRFWKDTIEVDFFTRKGTMGLLVKNHYMVSTK